MLRQFVRPLHTSAVRMAAQQFQGPIQQSMVRNLTAAFNPVHLEVINQSPNHNVPQGSESHFKVVIVSERFRGQGPVQKHRMVHQALAEELKTVHALSIVAKIPENADDAIPEDPKCMGGMKVEMRQRQQQQQDQGGERR